MEPVLNDLAQVAFEAAPVGIALTDYRVIRTCMIKDIRGQGFPWPVPDPRNLPASTRLTLRLSHICPASFW